MADSSPLPTTAESTPATQPDVKLSRPKMLLKLKSVNGASNSMKNILPQDETPTPTKLLKQAKVEDLFRAIDGHQNGEANPQNDKSSDNPFDQQFKKSITPSAKRTSAVEPNAEKDVVEIQQNEEHVDESVQNTVPNVGREVTVDAEQQTPVQQEPQQSERKSQEPQFKRPTDLPVPKEGQITTSIATATTSMQSMMQQQMPMLVLSGTQMAQQIASPTRLVMAQQDMFNGQNGQANNILVPSSNASTPMILTSPMSALGGQFILAPQMMQIQDPQTGAISQVITQSPQQQMPQFAMVQQVDANQLNQRTSNQQSNNQSAPPPYQQCVMALSPQIQFVAAPQQFQMVPTNQSMLVNQNGGQVQIINHGSIANNSQILQATTQTMNGQQTVPTNPIVQQPQSRSSTVSNDSGDSKISSGTLDENQVPLALTENGQLSDDGDDDSPSRRGGYARPSYTHRPSQIGLNNVVQLSKESLQAIEQAGVECGAGKRGGPRLNYDELDPKRRRFLERNRQAAARCRERKKQWIVSLEGRANELKAENQQVEDDIIRLKAKLDQLRGALDMQRQRHANGIDKENNLQSANVADMSTKPLNVTRTSDESTVNESLKTESAMPES